MITINVPGGDKGVRVIVDGKNEGSFEVAAGANSTVSFEGKLEIRALGVGNGQGERVSGQADGGGTD